MHVWIDRMWSKDRKGYKRGAIQITEITHLFSFT